MTIREDFKKIEKLYHYTTFKKAKLIIESNSLKFGKLPKMNDINERQKEVYIDNNSNGHSPSTDFAKIYKELKRLGQISLTRDKNKKWGFDIPAMWGHYAQNGSGVCFVLNKEKIIEHCKSEDNIYREVDYKDKVPSIDYNLGKYRNICTYFKKRAKSLFFTKTKDWSYEQEFRILSLDNNQEYLNIDGCILAIIIYHNTYKSAFDTSNYKRISQIVKEIPILVYSNTSMFGLNLIDIDENPWTKTPAFTVNIDWEMCRIL